MTMKDFCHEIEPFSGLCSPHEHPQGLSSCPVPKERLVRVHLLYRTFEGDIKEGELVIFDVLAQDVRDIFTALRAQSFPLHELSPLEKYEGSDERSMAANNSSAYNCRLITGQNNYSLHSYGMAIDINPIQNPYLAVPGPVEQPEEAFSESQHQLEHFVKVVPPQGVRYLNRRNQRPGMVEPVVSLFKIHGFTEWGGTWNYPIDYHHFQLPRPLAEILTLLTYEDGLQVFSQFKAMPALVSGQTTEEIDRWKSMIHASPKMFLKHLDIKMAGMKPTR